MRKIFPILLGLLTIAMLGCATIGPLLQDTNPDHVGVWIAPADTLRLAGDTTFRWTVIEPTETREATGIYMVGTEKMVFITGPSQQFAVVYEMVGRDSLTLGDVGFRRE